MFDVTGLSSSGFDEWYRAISAAGSYDDVMARGLGLPTDVPATGVVTAAAFDEVLEALALSPGELLLDLGCGRAGYGLLAVRRTAARLVGVDFSAVAVEVAQSVAERLGLADLTRFVLGDLTASGLASESVDAVMCLDSVQFASSTRAAVAECRRVLAPGGRLVFTCWEAAGAGDELPERLRQLHLEAALRDGGFEHVQVAERPAWLEQERRHWVAVQEMDPGDDVGLRLLQEEAEEVVPMISGMRRVLATALQPARSTSG